MFYQSQEHYQTMVEIFKEDLIINDHGGMGSCDCSTIEFDKGSAIAYLLDISILIRIMLMLLVMDIMIYLCLGQNGLILPWGMHVLN